MVWFFLIFILVVVLIYILSEHAMQVRSRKHQLEKIHKRLAEKKAEAKGDEAEEP